MSVNWPRVAAVIGIGALVIGLIWAAVVVWSQRTQQPLPMADQCRASLDGATVTLTPEQAENAVIIASVALTRNLPARAVSIALATAYQESGIRNLDYGHADSVGLFQQRPSQGWGTVKQIMDPYYSSGKFYTELVKVKNWRTDDINDVAQKVQRSGHPEAYRKHVSKARVLAMALTGNAPGAFTCTFDARNAPSPTGLADSLRRTYGKDVEVGQSPSGLVIRAKTASLAWAVAAFAVASAGDRGVARVGVGAAEWIHDPGTLAPWVGAGSGSVTTIGF